MAIINGLYSQGPTGIEFPELGDRFEEWWERGLEWYRDIRGQVGGPSPQPIPEITPAPLPSPKAATISNLFPLMIVIVGIVAVVWLKR